jgi:hypothetical protein
MSATLAALEQDFAQADTPGAYRAVRDAARAWPEGGAASVLAAAIAADCGYFLVTAFSPEPDGAQAADFIADLARAVALLRAQQKATPRALAERLIGVIDAASRLSHAGTRPGWEDPQAWAGIAAAIEAILPVDFRCTEATAGPAWVRRSWMAALSLGALSLLHGAVAHGQQRGARALEWLVQRGDILEHQQACHDCLDLLEACRAARPESGMRALWLHGLIAAQTGIWRARSRSRAGRLYAAQVFATVLDRMLVAALDMAEQPGFAPLLDGLHRHIHILAERGRSGLLLDQLRLPAHPFADPAQAADALARERAVLSLKPRPGEDGLVALEHRLVSQLPSVYWIDPRAGAVAREAFAARLAELAALEALFAAAGAGLVDTAGHAELAAVQQALTADEVLLTFAIPRETLHPARRVVILAITRAGMRTKVVDLAVLKPLVAGGSGFIGSLSLNDTDPIESSPLGDLIAITRIAIQERRDDVARERLAALHAVLVAPLAELGITPRAGARWFICPSGPLHALPFAALTDPAGHHLGETVALSIVPSASVWLALRAAWTDIDGFAGFANPPLDRAEWPDLPQAAAETTAAAKLLGLPPDQVHLGPDATLAAWDRDAPGAAILHVATHGDFPETDVIDLHALLLAPQPGDDGRLTAEHVLRTKLGRTRLAVLSACDGGLVRFGPGEELHGLTPACLCAGASNVLTTLWPVGDGMTALWMRAFYRQLRAAGPAEAARLATAGMIADGAAIGDWAPFVLLGATQGGQGPPRDPVSE